MSRPSRRLSAAKVEAAASEWVVRCDAGITPEEERDLEAWLAQDSRHAEAFARNQEAWRALDRPLRSGVADTAMRTIATRVVRRRHRRMRIGAMAAGVALLILAGTFRLPRLHEPPAPSQAMAMSTTVVLPERRTLPDGSVVELKAGADLAVDFSGPLRRVKLMKGEAHFQVAKNPDRSFVVTVSGVEVRAVGTAFSVRLDDAQLDVLITSGRVAVEKAATHEMSESDAERETQAAHQTLAIADAGTRVTVAMTSESEVSAHVTTLSTDELDEQLAWRRPMLEFSDTPLAEAVELFNRHGVTQLVVDDPALAATRVSGYFRADNTDTFVWLLEASFGAKAERSGETIRLRLVR